MDWMEPKQVRWRRYSVSAEFMRDMMTEGFRPRGDCMVIEGIPDGARVVRIGVAGNLLAFEIVVEHESFAELLEGMEIPHHHCVIRRDEVPEAHLA